MLIPPERSRQCLAVNTDLGEDEDARHCRAPFRLAPYAHLVPGTDALLWSGRRSRRKQLSPLGDPIRATADLLDLISPAHARWGRDPPLKP
jgi:hypothetical protein